MDRKAAVFIAMGFECFGLVAACVLIGRWIDQKYGSGSLWTGMGALVGVTAWVTHLLVLLKQLAKKQDPGHTDPQ